MKAIIDLFHPFIEAAVHDLEQGKIVALFHNISQRKVGDPSPLHELKVNISDFPDYFAPYYKQNWDGRPLKCTSITMRKSDGQPIGLICLNMDAGHFQDSFRLLESFLKTKKDAENPIEIYGSQCEDQASAVIEQFLKEKHVSLLHMTRDQKKELVQHLFRKGIFNFKNAVPFLAKKLNTSRASIYNYIKQI